MIYLNWIEAIRDAGGVSDCPKEQAHAYVAAKAFCYAELEKRGTQINSLVDTGVNFLAAFMVSCVKNEGSDILDIFTHRDDLGDVFRAEAVKNNGMIRNILNQAASTFYMTLKAVLVSAGATFVVAPTGRGKGKSIGTIRKLP